MGEEKAHFPKGISGINFINTHLSLSLSLSFVGCSRGPVAAAAGPAACPPGAPGAEGQEGAGREGRGRGFPTEDDGQVCRGRPY